MYVSYYLIIIFFSVVFTVFFLFFFILFVVLVCVKYYITIEKKNPFLTFQTDLNHITSL